MSSMMPVESYDAKYVDEDTHDWRPCKVIGVIKGDQATVIEFVILVTRHGKQWLERVETLRVETGSPIQAEGAARTV